MWTITQHGREQGMTFDHLGLIPTFLAPSSSLPAREQLDYAYSHGGGWRPLNDVFTLGEDNQLISKYDEPDLHPLAQTKLRDEEIFFYDHAWVVIKQPDGSFEVSRMD